MDKDYLKKNRLREISATFLGQTVTRYIEEDAQQRAYERAYERGILDLLNQDIKGHLGADLLTPTLKYLISQKLAVVADISGLGDRTLLDTLYSKRMDLDQMLIQEHDRSDAYLFLYAGDSAYRSILESEYIYRSGAFDHRARKIIGVYYDHCGKLDKDQIMFGALPKELIAKEKFIPYFVQEIIDNQ